MSCSVSVASVILALVYTLSTLTVSCMGDPTSPLPTHAIEFNKLQWRIYHLALARYLFEVAGVIIKPGGVIMFYFS